MATEVLSQFLQAGSNELRMSDPKLYEALVREQLRQINSLSLVASSSVVCPSVLTSQASVVLNVTAEGYPGRRFHAGCAVVDEIEQLAIDRASSVFGARYVNVQPHSATTANYTVLSSLLRPGDTLLGMALEHGGHLTHGSSAAYAGQYFNSIGYGQTDDGAIDYDQVRRLALTHQPRVIICGATAYPRRIEFSRFREIAEEVGAYLVADISHTAGLVAAGLHPNPIDHAHITTTCTHKQLYGPRGGLIMSGRDHDAPAPRGKGTLAAFLQRAVFPFSQGAPAVNTIAAKARALAEVSTPEFRALAQRIVLLADAIATRLDALGYKIVTGGTDNHIVLVDLGPDGITGAAAERALEECSIVVNKNRVPGDTRPAHATSGIRIGTNTIARRGLGAPEAIACADLVNQVMRAVETCGQQIRVPATVREATSRSVARLCAAFPLPGYSTVGFEPAQI
jgi:glycine hydroxymethyltransferase